MYLPLGFSGSGQSIEQQLNECCIRRILSKDDTLRADLGRRIAELELQLTGRARPVVAGAVPVEEASRWGVVARS